jgi:hypothetical protein
MADYQLPPAWMNPYPFQIQAMAALQRGIKKFLLIWPRRTGKDLTSLILGAMAYNMGLVGPGSLMYVFPEKDQGRRAIWDTRPFGRTERYIDVIPNITNRNEREMRMTFRYPTLANYPASYAGANCYLEVHDANPNSMVGGNQNIIACSEYGLPKMAGFLDYVRPIINENKGICILNGTVRGKNHMYHLYEKVKNDPEWFVSYLTNETALDCDGKQIVTEEDILREIAQGMDPATARQEYGNRWETPSAGAYYTSQMLQLITEGRIRQVPWDPNRKVMTGWDLGLSDPTVIWFAQENEFGGLNLIDFEAGSGKSFADWLPKLREGPKRARYSYSYHFVPHDIKQTIDGGAEGNPFRRIDLAYELGYDMTPIESRPGALNEGISQVANLLPLCFFDQQGCDIGIEALKHYRAKETAILNSDGSTMFEKKPLHDQYSDPADAFRMLTLGFNRYVKRPVGSGPDSSTSRKRFVL